MSGVEHIVKMAQQVAESRASLLAASPHSVRRQILEMVLLEFALRLGIGDDDEGPQDAPTETYDVLHDGRVIKRVPQ